MTHPAADQNAFKVGETVECHDNGQWRKAVISSLATYGGGYYILWTDAPYSEEERRAKDLPMPSSGGWAYNAMLRRVP